MSPLKHEGEERQRASTGVPSSSPSQHPRLRSTRFHSLKDALSVSRPGDCVQLEPGVHFAKDLVVRCPVQIIGRRGCDKQEVEISEKAPEVDALPSSANQNQKRKRGWEQSCPNSERAILEFQASCRLSGVSIKANLGPCIWHRKGNLVIERCALLCAYHPLEHLNIPIITTASASARDGDACAAAGPGGDGVEDIKTFCGKLSVKETQIEGGNKAVGVCSIDNSLRDVRTFCRLFWFVVAPPGERDGTTLERIDSSASMEVSARKQKRRKILVDEEGAASPESITIHV